MVLSVKDSLLLVIDIQERLLPAIDEPETMLERNELLLKAAADLTVPVIASEQYPKGLGPTVRPLVHYLAGEPVIQKLEFSLAAIPTALQQIGSYNRKQIILTGIEAHICVLQTALGLRASGFAVHVVADAIGSRNPDNKKLAIERLRQAGVVIVSSEMVVFEWLSRAGTDVFRTLSKLVR